MWLRRAIHIAIGTLIALGVLLLPKQTAEWSLIAATLFMIAFDAARAAAPKIHDVVERILPIFKPTERAHITGATFMALSATFLVFVFNREVAALALLFLAVGDPCAAIVGVRDRRLRAFGKSLLGTAAFAVAAIAAAAIASLHPNLPLTWTALAGAATAALAELAPLPIDDNITIPLASASVMAALALVVA